MPLNSGLFTSNTAKFPRGFFQKWRLFAACCDCTWSQDSLPGTFPAAPADVEAQGKNPLVALLTREGARRGMLFTARIPSPWLPARALLDSQKGSKQLENFSHSRDFREGLIVIDLLVTLRKIIW